MLLKVSGGIVGADFNAWQDIKISLNTGYPSNQQSGERKGTRRWHSKCAAIAKGGWPNIHIDDGSCRGGQPAWHSVKGPFAETRLDESYNAGSNFISRKLMFSP